MQRQLWIFLEDSDEEEFLARLDSVQPFRRLAGRFFKGSEDDLRARPETLETAQLRAGERWVHLIQPEVSRALVAHPVTEGPFQGWSRLDEVRSEVLTLVRAAKDAQGLAPSRLMGTSSAWFAGVKTRKSLEFSTWLSAAMGLVETAYPATEYDWMRVAPGALTFQKTGGRLHYLYREVKLATTDAAPYTPHKRG